MKLINLNQENDIFILETSKKLKQQYYFTFFLSNEISYTSLGLFFQVKEKYLWLLEKQTQNILEGHAFINLNHLHFDLKVQTYKNGYKYQIKATYVNLDLDEKLPLINSFIKNIFKPIDLNKLSNENQLLLFKHIYNYLGSQKDEFNKVDLEKNLDMNNISTNLNFLLNKEGYNQHLHKLDINVFANEMLQNIQKVDQNFFQNIVELKQTFRVINANNIVNIKKLVTYKIETEIKCEDIEINKLNKQYIFKDFVSLSEYYLLYQPQNTLKEKLTQLYINDLIWNFYFEVVREKYQLIYSPVLKVISHEPCIIKVSNNTQNKNLSKLLKLESVFTNDILKYSTQKQIINFKHSLVNEFWNSIEEIDVMLYCSIAYYFDNYKQNYYDTKTLENWYYQQIQDLNSENILNNNITYNLIAQQLTKGQ